MAEQSSLRRDIVSAYLASGAKIGSWVVVSAMVYRLGWHAQFGLLALIRGTLGILNYVSVGIVSALVRMIAETHSQPQEVTAATTGRVLSYYAPAKQSRVAVLYSNAITWTALFATIATFFLIGYAFFFEEFHRVPVSLSGWSVAYTVLFLGLGLLIRLISDAPGAVLQTTGRIAYDNRLLIEAELLWVVATWGLFESKVWNQQIMVHAAMGFLIASLFLIIRRLIGASLAAGIPRIRLDETITRPLLRMGALVTLAQLGDYLYAPTDYILINKFLGNIDVAAYAPAVQIDAALLVLVSGMAAVLFPRSALAHAAGDAGAVRRYYVRGTLASAGILVVAGLSVWVLSPVIFRLWLGTPLMDTRIILPLVLIHTVIGGSSMVGRSILLGTGKFKPFAISVLIAGVTNVVLSYIFVKHFRWGLKGIIYGTIIAVVARCLLWMPWYVMRSLKHAPLLIIEPASVPTI